MSSIKIIGIGAYAPEFRVKNEDMEKIVETNDEWIVQRTGIHERRISKGEGTVDLAYKAALSAIEKANISPNEIDLIIAATATPDNFTPTTACELQTLLKADNAFAFDINAACSGFTYALSVASRFIECNNVKCALVVGAEVLSKVLDWKDRGTCILMGDGAGAAIITKDDKNLFDFTLKTKGDRGKYLSIKGLPIKNAFYENEEKADSFVKMDGREIFKFAVDSIVNISGELLKKNNLSLDDIKYIVPHQANRRIIEFAAVKLKTSIDKFYLNIDSYGNTSAASIPLALNQMDEEGLLKKKDKLLLVAFGGGLTAGGILIEW